MDASFTTVLRNADLRGHCALPGRRRASGDGVCDSERPPASDADPAGHIDTKTIPPPSLQQLRDDAVRQGYEEGLAQGRIAGDARGREEARELAAQTAREMEARAEDMAESLKRDAEAVAQAQGQWRERLRAVEDLLAALPGQITARLDAAEDDMLALCFDAVCRVLGEAAADVRAIRAQLRQASDALRGRALVSVHLHPDHLAALRADSQGPSGLPFGAGVEWVASPEVELGGCVLRSPEGGLDARLDTQIGRLRELLLRTRAGAAARTLPTTKGDAT